MTPFLKSLLGIGLAGGGAGLSVGGYYLLKSSEPTTLLEKFKKENTEILNYKTGDDQAWNTKLTKYKTSSEENNRFENLTGTEDEALQKLKDKCKGYLEQSPEEVKKTPGLEDKVKKWCTTSTTA